MPPLTHLSGHDIVILSHRVKMTVILSQSWGESDAGPL